MRLNLIFLTRTLQLHKNAEIPNVAPQMTFASISGIVPPLTDANFCE
jgi:hypothetical protein